MDVRLIGERAAPGVQDTEDPAAPPDVMRVRREREERLARGAEHDVVQVSLRAAAEFPQLVGQGHDHVTIGDREQFPAPVCQPGCGVAAMTLGAATVAAGVVDIVFLTTVVTLQQVPA
jgi:hypothetical protein